MQIIYKIFWGIVVSGSLLGYSVQAQVFATPETAQTSQAAKASVSAAKSKSQSQDLLAPVEKNFNSQPQNAIEPQNDPQIFHFNIVNNKVTLVDPEKRNILVYYDNYRIIRGFDKLTKCSIRVYVINDLKEKITSLGLKLHWPEISTGVEMAQVKPGVKTYTDLMLIGDGCLRLDKIPTIEVNRCRVKGMSQDACADSIIWMPQ